MKSKKTALSLVLVLLISLSSIAQKKIQALIIDGQNNHGQWPKVTYMMKSYLENSGLFTVDIERSAFTWHGEDFLSDYKIADMPPTVALKKAKTDPNFSPKFKKYDVVICNFGWGAASWPTKTKIALNKFVKKGGGLVIVHAADNSFADWPEYNKMIGLGGWGNRNEKDGPYVYYNEEDRLIRDNSKGKGGSHGSQHEFQITIRDTEHPITKGMPLKWLHSKDELYDRLRGPAENMKVLATAFSSKDKKGTGRHEPMLMTINYGKGKVFHTPMGHIDYSLECVGFITSLIRGAEWAATGIVSSPIPIDFPTANKVSTRKFD